MNHDGWKNAVTGQFGAAIDMLERGIHACPEPLWGDRTRYPEYWYIVFHVLFWLDCYLSESPDGFAPPAPFGLEEMDPAGVLPPRVYTKEELLAYLAHGRAKMQRRLAGLSAEQAARTDPHSRAGLSVGEMQMYSLRHVQHHVGQLYLILRQVTHSDAPRWVSRGALSTPTGA